MTSEPERPPEGQKADDKSTQGRTAHGWPFRFQSPCTRQKKTYYARIKKYFRKIENVIAFLTLLAVGLYTYVNILEYCAANKAVSAAIIQAKEATAQANIAASQEQTAIDTLHASERPWVSVESVKFDSFTDLATGQDITLTKDTAPGLPIQIELSVTFQNTGPSTATEAVYDVNSNLDGTVDNPACKRAFATSLALAKYGHNDQSFVLVLGQSVVTQQYMWPPKVGLLYGDMLSPNESLQVFVCVAYKDQFFIQHHTQDCFVISQPMKAGGTPTFIPCEQGDEAD